MCDHGCACDKCWTHFFQVRWPALVANLVLNSIALDPVTPSALTRKHVERPRPKAPAHKVSTVRHQRRQPRAPDRQLVDVEDHPVEEPTRVPAAQPPVEESSTGPKESPGDEGSRDLRTITKEEAVEIEKTQPVVHVTVPRPRFPQMDFRSPRPAPAPVSKPKHTVNRVKALKEIRARQLRDAAEKRRVLTREHAVDNVRIPRDPDDEDRTPVVSRVVAGDDADGDLDDVTPLSEREVLSSFRASDID